MLEYRSMYKVWGWMLAGLMVAACSAAPGEGDTEKPVDVTNALTAQDRLAACSQDPRVTTGLVGTDVCAGADIFFRETFNGNGRTCGSCHPVANNTTLDVPFVTALHDSNPNDPLFVFETDPNLSQLETGDLRDAAAVLENVDGFEDPTHKFVERAVNHMLSLRTSILRDPGDGTSSPPIEGTGWGGDGAPDDGTLRSFLTGAIRQHFTKTLARREGIDFRLPTSLELDLNNAFQLSLGRQTELDLNSVRITDAAAEDGRQAFLDPQRGRCNVCHANAGANFLDTRLNRNFDTGIRNVTGNLDQGLTQGTQNGQAFVDGGFGATTPIDGDGAGFNNAFGNDTFNPPPLIEAADTGPFFHNNARGPEIEDAVAFYASAPFQFSPAAQALQIRFGTPLNLVPVDALNIARFLRVLNTAFNVDIALQRLSAAQTIVARFADQSSDIQKMLIQLAGKEIDDALRVLGAAFSLYPSAQTSLNQCKTEVIAGISATTAAARSSHINNALAFARSARAQFGTNITFLMGQGNLMF